MTYKLIFHVDAYYITTKDGSHNNLKRLGDSESRRILKLLQTGKDKQEILASFY